MMMRSCATSARRASSMAMPGNVVGMTSREPSSSGGMNSDPRRWNTGTVATMSTMAAATTRNRKRTTSTAIGRYTALRSRLTGFVASVRKRPRSSSTINGGASVIDRIAAANMANVLV